MHMLAVVAMRVHALYNGTRWIKVFLGTVGALYATSSITIIIVAGIQLIRAYLALSSTMVV